MNQFNFDKYEFDIGSKTARLYYSYEDGPSFVESYKFDFDFADFDASALDRALQTLFLICGVSYYKAYLATTISLKTVTIDTKIAEFMTKTYQKGLGELLYVNGLDPNLQITFPANAQQLPPLKLASDGILVGIGGGKDSLLGVELLRNAPKLATWSLGHKSQLSDLIQTIGTPHFFVERQIDPKIIELNNQPGVYNGHVPISAIFAAVGTVVAVLSGYRDTVVSNEYSANEATLEYKGVQINHQYSKTSEFEQAYQSLLAGQFDDSIRYYSILRPLREVPIARAFAESYFAKYKAVFSSCNRAFTQDSDRMFWCGECPKCAAVYLFFAPFMPESELTSLFNGKNLLIDDNLELIYKQLLGIAEEKPLECVGEIAESRWAMSQMKARYPQLEKFVYEEASDQQVWHSEDHSIPADIIDEFDLTAKFEQLSTAPKNIV